MSPRTKLLNNKPLADRVRDMVDGEVFDTAADVALLQLIEEVPKTNTIEQNALTNAYIMGARDFLKLFRRIADVTKPYTTPDPDNLNPRA